MNKKPFYRRPWFACIALMLFCLASYATFQALRPTSYQLFQRIKIGDTFALVTDLLGQPEDAHTSTNGTDYTFVVYGDPEYPKLMGVPFPVHRIVRISGGLVVSKGPVEDYHESHSQHSATRRVVKSAYFEDNLRFCTSTKLAG